MPPTRADERANLRASKPLKVYRRQVAELTRSLERPRDPTSRTLHFTFPGGPKARRSAVTFVEVENVPEFEGQSAWFELELVEGHPWSFWRAVRQVEPPAHARTQR